MRITVENSGDEVKRERVIDNRFRVKRKIQDSRISRTS
jgi:hypothetical protein